MDEDTSTEDMVIRVVVGLAALILVNLLVKWFWGAWFHVLIQQAIRSFP